MKWPWVSRALYEFAQEQLARVENENRQLLSALLEHTVSREAGMMLRTPEELNLTLEDFKKRAAARYQASRPHSSDSAGLATAERENTVAESVPADLRHWRDARGNFEAQTYREYRAEHSNDSVERIEQKVEASRKAARQ